MSARAGETRIEALAVEAPVAEVTLFEDRARVVRRAVVELESGRQRLRVSGVAPVLSDATLFAVVESNGASAVDVRPWRLRIARDEVPDDARERLEREQETLARRIEALKAGIARRERELARLGELEEQELAEIAEEAAWGRDDAAAWQARLDRIRERACDRRTHLDDARLALEKDEQESQRLRERRQARDDPSRREHAELLVELEVETPGEHRLRIEYMVPGACWRPWHTARLLEGPTPRVAFRTDGCVWQRTGEDWEGVRLRFSTQRPSRGTAPPELLSDPLSVQPRAEETEVEARDVEVATTGLGGGAARPGGALPGIDDGGQELALEADGVCRVPSDGRPWRVGLMEFESEAELGLATWPERLGAVLLRSLQSHAGDRPILAGPVDLVRAGGYAGRTSVLFIAPGERFALCWGAEPELRVHREVEEVREEQRLPGTWPTRRHRTRVRVSNLGAEERKLRVTERLPVSEIDKVVIQPDVERTTNGHEPDADGFVRWDVVIAPGDRRELELAWTLKHHPSVAGV
jgi:hypothetical protein